MGELGEDEKMSETHHHADTTRRLVERLTEELAEAKATTNAIRDSIDLLYLGPYAPSEAAVRRALYPDYGLVKSFIPKDAL
jgi:hypothetical protein